MTELKERLKAAMTGPIVTPEDAERAARAAEALAAYIRAETSAERALALDEAQSSSAPRAGDLEGLKLEDAAERVLDRVGRPMHVRELGKRIKDGGWDHP
ncbi:MAG: winged helix-turn-helix domain-containing protein, partial [Actinomycetota bacterium]|nr:winged helix-turn-helix domain-containing protein [Actinomycetota bacterium]